MPNRDPWLFESPFKFKIEVTLGTQPYVTVYSDAFDVIITDTCKQTSLIDVSIGPYVVADDEISR